MIKKTYTELFVSVSYTTGKLQLRFFGKFVTILGSHSKDDFPVKRVRSSYSFTKFGN